MTSKEARLHPERLDFKEYEKADEGGVVKYAILEDGIVLVFKDNEYYYLYNFVEPGIEHIEEMITKAEKGKKLNTYVTQIVRGNYADKWIPATERRPLT
jgi:hypothetical protein